MKIQGQKKGAHGREALKEQALGVRLCCSHPPGGTNAETWMQAATLTSKQLSGLPAATKPKGLKGGLAEAWVLPARTLVQTPVVASHRVRMDTFCARLSQFTATLVLVAHFTMVM